MRRPWGPLSRALALVGRDAAGLGTEQTWGGVLGGWGQSAKGQRRGWSHGSWRDGEPPGFGAGRGVGRCWLT